MFFLNYKTFSNVGLSGCFNLAETPILQMYMGFVINFKGLWKRSGGALEGWQGGKGWWGE